MIEKAIFLFLDGVGIGEAKESNPFYAAKARYLPFYGNDIELPDQTRVKPIDALLGVEGTPQSATGQSSLFTGENIPALLQEHKGSYPNKVMRKIIKERNIFSQLKALARRVVFINAYPLYGEYFTGPHVEIKDDGEFHFSHEFPERYRRRISVSSCLMISVGQVPFTEKHIQGEKAIFQDYSNRGLIGMGLDVLEFSPEKAAEILYRVSRDYDFMLYEYFLTDYYGHRCSFEEQVELIKGLDRLVGALVSRLDREVDTLVLTSDHGNLEESSHRGHTQNPVPLLTWGKHSGELRESIHSLTDVTPGIVGGFKRGSGL